MMQTIFDPLRHKDVALTPEERVRQWFVSQLLGPSAVPAHLMMTEAGLKFGGKVWRVDILVYDRQGQPLAVVECKRPELDIDAGVAEQAMRYNIVLGVRWLLLTNGRSLHVYRREGDCFRPFGKLPTYEEMTA